MPLDTYRAKRNLQTTPEPAGGKPSAGQLRFCVQKHDASRLHYDFRLELDGVLLSWAVPKGPSLNTSDKRLAMMVEDHPLDYRLFEGVIPQGNYGAGNVIVWDEGTYEDYEHSGSLKTAAKNLRAGLQKGDLKFTLHGRKLNGSFVLAKIKDGKDANAWLLIKKKDAFASTEDVTAQDRSVLTGRTVDQAGEPPLDLSGAPKAKQPEILKPMLATLADKPFDRPEYLYEIKWDGYRILAHIKDGAVTLKSRNDQDYSQVFKPVTEGLTGLTTDCILDGEVVVLDANGRSDFGALQNYQRTAEGDLYYLVFDVPYAAGHDLRKLPLTRRKEIASSLIAGRQNVRYSDHITGRGTQFFELAQQQNLEGIMAKAAASPYQAGRRTQDWLKVKTHRRQEAVIAGYTAPRGSRHKLGALVLGVYDGGDKLQYIGHTGTGMDDATLENLYYRLSPLERSTSPFLQPPKTNSAVTWVEPKLVAEISFSEWTSDGSMRHPVFMGLREDKRPHSVTKEQAMAAPKPAPARKPERTAPSSDSAVREVEITHPDKIFWPQERYTKGDLAEYYAKVADTILPYLNDRPESLNRFPNGISGSSFFQKDLENHPDWVATAPLFSESNNKDIRWLICNDAPTLRYMVNLGCIELNPWLSRLKTPDHPDFCLLDIDAKESPFEHVIEVAREFHKLLDSVQAPHYVKTSGKTGIHIAVPLGAKYTYEQSKQFAEIMVREINHRLPDLTSVERKPEKRGRKIYLDYLQNRKGQTMAAPYCVRPVPGATVSTPLKWSEVRRGLDPTKFTINSTPARLQKLGDLWSGLLEDTIDMAAILDRLS